MLQPFTVPKVRKPIYHQQKEEFEGQECSCFHDNQAFPPLISIPLETLYISKIIHRYHSQLTKTLKRITKTTLVPMKTYCSPPPTINFIQVGWLH